MKGGVQQLRANQPHVGVCVGVCDHRLQRVAGHLRIRVQEQDVAPWRDSESLVVGRRETPVVGVGDEMHAGELGLYHFDTAVAGGVVHDDDFGIGRLD